MKSFNSPSKATVNRANSALQLVSQPNKIIVDNRPLAVTQRKLQEKIDQRATVQRRSIPTINPLVTQIAQLMGKKDNGNSKRKRNDSDSDSDGSWEPPTPKKTDRFHIPKAVQDQVVLDTAHKRKHVDKSKYKAVYTCRNCRRPLMSIKKGGKKLEQADYSYTSKENKRLHTMRALALDHFPQLAARQQVLKDNGATEDELREDHNDPTKLRAICTVCNGSHKLEHKKVPDYESDDDESGFETPDDEPENKGYYKPFRYDDNSGGGAAGMVC